MWSSFAAAFRGLTRALKTQPHVRFDVLVGALVIAAGLFFRVAVWEWIVLVSAITAMLVLELINTTVEFLCDLLQPRLHSSVAVIKDAASAAVLVGAIGVVVVGLIVFLPHFVSLADF
jgi:diacylglycerol kinase